jgi:hypothetical protein
MNARQTWFGLALASLVVAIGASAMLATPAGAQKARGEPRYEYRVVPFRYSPDERLGAEARAKRFEHLLNEYARDGWEPVLDLLNRSAVQTIGGGVTTRETITFIAFRRPR